MNACGDKQGTKTGYMRHWRANEPACASCRQANAQHTATYRQSPRGRANKQANDRKHINTPAYKARTQRYRQSPKGMETNRQRTRRYRATKRRGYLLPAYKPADGDRCVCCGTDEQLQLDHIVPLRRRGADHPRNYQPLCLPCNGSKGDTQHCRKHGTYLGPTYGLTTTATELYLKFERNAD